MTARLVLVQLAANAALAFSHGRQPMVGGTSGFESRECGASDGKQFMGAFTKLTYHIVFSTKYRAPTIQEEFRERLYEYIGGTVRALNGHLIEIGGIEDHVHLLVSCPPAMALSQVIRDIKANASRWVNDKSLTPNRFEWQKGYGAFTVSYSQRESVRRYIRNQREHHRRVSFKEEYVEFLRRHEIPFEEVYLFEAEHHG